MARRAFICLCILAAMGIVGAACGADPEAVVASSSDGTAAAEGSADAEHPSSPRPDPAHADDPLTATVGDVTDEAGHWEGFLDFDEPCPTTPFENAQFAFVGEVVATESLLNEDKVFEAEERLIEVTEELRADLVWTWVTFDVEGWYTRDWGTSFSVWMPRFDVDVGQRWLMAGDAHHVVVGDFSGQSGTADPCIAETFTPAGRAIWDEHFRGSVQPGAAGPEAPPSPKQVAVIDAAEQQWESTGITTYTVVRAFGTDDPATGECSERRLTRVVVAEASVVQAVNVNDGCEVDQALIATPAALFDAAREYSGTENFRFEADAATGFPLAFSAGDRSARVSYFVEDFEPGRAALAVAGWVDTLAALQEGRERWVVADLSRYDFELDLVCGICGTTLTGSVGGDDRGISSDGWLVGTDLHLPLWIEEHFDYVASHATDNPVVAVFDEQYGYLRDMWLDQNIHHGDHEIHVRVTPR